MLTKMTYDTVCHPTCTLRGGLPKRPLYSHTKRPIFSQKETNSLTKRARNLILYLYTMQRLRKRCAERALYSHVKEPYISQKETYILTKRDLQSDEKSPKYYIIS